MTDFPRTILPRTNSPPVLPGPLFSISESGKMQTRSTQRVGWSWEESFLFPWDATGRRFVSLITNYFRNGTQLDVTHQDLTLIGAGGGTPLVDAAAQTGNSIDTKGWPISTAVLLSGDFVTFAGIDQVYSVVFTVNSDGAGDASIFIDPPIFDGGSPADEAAVTITDSVVFKAKITSFDLPSHDAAKWVAPRITLVEDP